MRPLHQIVFLLHPLCLLPSPTLFSSLTHSVSLLHILCLLTAPTLFPSCTYSVFFLHPLFSYHTHSVSLLHILCLLPAPTLFSSCTYSVFLALNNELIILKVLCLKFDMNTYIGMINKNDVFRNNLNY